MAKQIMGPTRPGSQSEKTQQMEPMPEWRIPPVNDVAEPKKSKAKEK